MSDTSQGEGWWLASDGKWYPPEQRPAEASPSPEPPAEAPFNPNVTMVIRPPAEAPTSEPSTAGADTTAVGEAASTAAPGAAWSGPAPLGAPAGPEPVTAQPAASDTPAAPAPAAPAPGIVAAPGAPGPTAAPGFPAAAPGAGPPPLGGPPIPGAPVSGAAPMPKKGGGAKVVIALVVVVLVLVAAGVAVYALVINKSPDKGEIVAKTGISTDNTDTKNAPQYDLNLPPAGKLTCEGSNGELTSASTLTNKSSASSDYVITVEFRQDGKPVATGETKVPSVAAGKTADWTVTAPATIEGQFSCKVVKVDRFNVGTTTPN